MLKSLIKQGAAAKFYTNVIKGADPNKLTDISNVRLIERLKYREPSYMVIREQDLLDNPQKYGKYYVRYDWDKEPSSFIQKAEESIPGILGRKEVETRFQLGPEKTPRMINLVLDTHGPETILHLTALP